MATVSPTTQSEQTENKIPSDIRGFLEDMLLASDMIPENEIMKDIMIKQLFERLDQYIAMRLVEFLSEEDAETFIQMNQDKKSKEELETFLQSHIPNAQEKFVEILLDFRNQYTADVNAQPAPTTDLQSQELSDQAQSAGQNTMAK